MRHLGLNPIEIGRQRGASPLYSRSLFCTDSVGAVALLGADMAMYEAKSTGRDRVIAAESFAVSTRHEKWRGVARRREEAIAEPTFLQAAPGLARKRLCGHAAKRGVIPSLSLKVLRPYRIASARASSSDIFATEPSVRNVIVTQAPLWRGLSFFR